jgi:hypothetical protein
MIRFSLKCDGGHGFEAWFRNGDTYARQEKRGEVRCPDCGSNRVTKAIMAPAIARGRRRDETPSPRKPEAAAKTPAAVPAPAAPEMHVAGKLREALVEMRRFIEKNAEYVGPRFADEARKMHSGEAGERSIYGEASDEEAEALKDEGIEFGRIPWPKYRHDG